MLIRIEFFVKDPSELDSLELDSRLSSSSYGCLSYKLTELPLECSEKVWNMLSVQHSTPLAFSSHSMGVESENRGSRL